MGQMQGNLYPPTRSSVGQASKSTAKRGWIKRWPATDNRKYRAGPDAAGATRNRDGSNAAGATRSTAVSSETLERAGRRPALSFPSSRSGSIVPKGPMTPSSPGLTAIFPAAPGVAKWTGMPVASPCLRGQGCLPRRAAGRRAWPPIPKKANCKPRSHYSPRARPQRWLSSPPGSSTSGVGAARMGFGLPDWVAGVFCETLIVSRRAARR
jgi:hypothetical protein